MTPQLTSPAEYSPIFNWSAPRSRKRSLLSFIAASVFLHALCFYTFQIIYPPTVALLPPPARVNIINSASEEGRVLLRWIEAEDPALSSMTQRPPDAASARPPVPQYVPSYVGHIAALKESLPYAPDLRVPSARPPGPVPIPRAHTLSPAEAVRTTINFSEGIKPAAIAQIALPPFSASNRDAPQPADFRVALSPQGEVRYCFLQNSSGDAALDEQARSYLLQTRFGLRPEVNSANGNTLLWTTATIQWSSDIAPPVGIAADASKP